MSGAPTPGRTRVTPRFAGVRTFMRLPYVEEPGAPSMLDGVDFAILGFPCDTATSYRPGARFGPEAIRSVSVLLRPYHPEHRIDVLETLTGVDAGDLPLSPGETERSYALAEEALAPVVRAGAMPLVLGGDHSITLAPLRALAAQHGPLALVHLDAHGDTWDEYFGQRYFHGTTFRRAVEEGVVDVTASLQVGLRGPLYVAEDLELGPQLGFTVRTIAELRELGPAGFGELARRLAGDRPVFVSFDVDVCDPAFAPGTGTPEVGGLSSSEAVAFLRALAGIDLVGADVVEVAPPYDGPGQPTAVLAANVAWELLALAAVGRGRR